MARTGTSQPPTVGSTTTEESRVGKDQGWTGWMDQGLTGGTRLTLRNALRRWPLVVERALRAPASPS